MVRPNPFPANVLFLRMRGFAALDATQQAARRARLTRTLAGLVPLYPEDARVVVQAPDGAAIVGLDDPVQALEAARLAALEPELDIGLHHGLVRTRKRDAAQLTGEGLETAQAITGLSPEHPLLATSEFRRALHAAAPHLGRALRTAGKFMDAQEREQRLHAPEAAEPEPPADRRQLLLGSAAIVAILCAGAVARAVRLRDEAARRPAVLRLDIRPGGEIWVDGELKGQVPPLTRLAVPPGPHVIEVRLGKMTPLRMDVQLKPGEEIDVKHIFIARQPPRRVPSLLERFKFWGSN
ncbi:hypothetical protein FN976_00805 [Caenimonas sedimenti]|uniref:PEGA domain-containing protein n=1 Tax=Caenimonas sedimenti TaxID=2596921 RepID=A0A562ZYD3_9BURK|nr:hypothetical protein [Caenimonas sedimenti]TWO73417.1 hypothetical protein FN976_00805 [Caenimonas sedimenti]